VMDVKKTNELYEKLKGRLPCKLFVTGSTNHFHNDRWRLIQQETLKFFDQNCGVLSGKACEEKHILIIDDDPLVTRSLQVLLTRSGFTNVRVCNDGETALKLMIDFKERMGRAFNLVISDIRMPGIDGVETIRRAKNIIEDKVVSASPVIFITGYEGDSGKARASEVGYMDYFYKPLDLDKFVESVRRHLA
jgi:CheY-like chemotaxis protein